MSRYKQYEARKQEEQYQQRVAEETSYSSPARVYEEDKDEFKSYFFYEDVENPDAAHITQYVVPTPDGGNKTVTVSLSTNMYRKGFKGVPATGNLNPAILNAITDSKRAKMILRAEDKYRQGYIQEYMVKDEGGTPTLRRIIGKKDGSWKLVPIKDQSGNVDNTGAVQQEVDKALDRLSAKELRKILTQKEMQEQQNVVTASTEEMIDPVVN